MANLSTIFLAISSIAGRRCWICKERLSLDQSDLLSTRSTVTSPRSDLTVKHLPLALFLFPFPQPSTIFLFDLVFCVSWTDISVSDVIKTSAQEQTGIQSSLFPFSPVRHVGVSRLFCIVSSLKYTSQSYILCILLPRETRRQTNMKS